MFISNLTRTNELPEDDTSCVETCRSSLFVISAVIIIDIYVHSLVELKIKKPILDSLQDALNRLISL